MPDRPCDHCSSVYVVNIHTECACVYFCIAEPVLVCRLIITIIIPSQYTLYEMFVYKFMIRTALKAEFAHLFEKNCENMEKAEE